MGLFKKLFSILQGDSEEKDIENLSGTSNSQETNCSEEEAAAKAKTEEEAAAKAKAEEEAAAKAKAEEEAANPTLVDSAIANQLTDGGKKKNVILPASVCEIEIIAFLRAKLECIDMTSCNKLTIINRNAFAECVNLTNIIFPENIEEIGEAAFHGCEALTSIDLSNCKKLNKIGEKAFKCCSSLKEVLLPESLSSIGKEAFYGCKIENIDFSACKLLTKFPDSLFDRCKSLEEVVWPPHLKEIGDLAFSECESLRRVELPDSVEVLGEGIFNRCDLKSLSLPKDIKKMPKLSVIRNVIKSLDMSRCKKLKVLTAPLSCYSNTIVFPIGVEEIEVSVFYRSGFKSIYLPPTIKEVELDSSADEANVYCYAPELENVKDIIEKCACLLVLPQYYDNYYDQVVAEGAEGCLDKIPEDKLYFYDE